MQINIRRSSSVPVYRQLEKALAQAIVKGSLKAGHRLSSARTLASDLGVNRLTVEAAFDALESAGLIERRHGSGTYVLPSFREREETLQSQRSWPLWQARLQSSGAEPSPAAPRSQARFDFASGMGDPRTIPTQDFLRCLRDVVRRDGSEALGYENAQGYGPLRASIAEILSSQGLPARRDDILVTTGSQQAISLTAQALLRPGDTILVEETCYDAALALFRMLGLRIVSLPMDSDGIIVERIEPLLQRHRPGLLYCMPNYQNPTGAMLSAARRPHLVALAERYHFPILEDDYVGDLRYEGNALPSLKALDRGGCVLHTSTFSKMLMPGVRLGFLLAEGPVLAHLTGWKRRLEIANASLLQRALHAYISVGRYRRHVNKSRRIYAARRDAMVAAIRRHFPRGTRFERPKGGLFLWLGLPIRTPVETLLKEAQHAGIDIAGGRRYDATAGEDLCAAQEAGRHIRLNFAAVEIPVIEEGMARLGALVSRLSRKSPSGGS